MKLAREVAAETGLAPARIDGLLALKGVIVQDEVGMLDPVARRTSRRRDPESLATAFDALVKARVQRRRQAGAAFAGPGGRDRAPGA